MCARRRPSWSKAERKRLGGGSLPQGSASTDPWSLSQDSAKAAPDSDIVGPASGVAWPAPRQWTMRDLKQLRLFVVGDSSLCAHDASGHWYDLEDMFKALGWNIIFEARRGEGPPQWAGLLRSYVEVNKEFLIRDGAGGLQFPPEFIFLAFDSQNNLHWRDGACVVRSVDEIPEEYVRDYIAFTEMMGVLAIPGIDHWCGGALGLLEDLR